LRLLPPAAVFATRTKPHGALVFLRFGASTSQPPDPETDIADRSRPVAHPALEPILPKPVAAGRALPDWLRDMPSEVAAPSLGGKSVRTLKHCPPRIDALSLGVLIPLATDLTFTEGEVSWDWAPPVLEDARISRAPIGMHVPEQASGAPFRMAPGLILKFMNFWTLEAPEG